MIQSLRAAILFLTRIPLPGGGNINPNALATATAWFPLIGILIGAAMGGMGMVLLEWLDPMITATLVVAFGVLLTGAMHEDGLADAADGLGGGWNPAQRLEIMRDSRIGSYGGIAIVLAIMLRITTLAATPPGQWLTTLVVAHALARWAGVLLLRLPYARTEGKAAPMIAGIRPWHGVVASVTAVALAIATSALITVAWVLFVVGLSSMWFRKKVGGITGDLLGAAIVITELGILVLFST